MKKIHLVLVAMFILSGAAVLVFSPFEAESQKKITQTVNVIPDNVAQILNNSCTSCHGNGGNGMAMSMWNFSVWDTYAADKQAKKATAICNAITKGSMPPGSVKKANPERIPTAAQIEIICKWATSLKVK
jgi:hypothetical protein